MALGVRFEAVDELPLILTPGTLYFRKRVDGEFDLVTPEIDGSPVFARRPHLQMAFEASGVFIPAGEEIGRYLTVEDIELDALLSGAVSATPATDERDFTIHRGVDLVARFRFPAGQSQAQVLILMPTVPMNNLLIFRTPSSSDATLSGVTGTLGARRT
ncbi:MAG: hypothetical protein V4696_03770 [Pseudomonadota bacterium]